MSSGPLFLTVPDVQALTQLGRTKVYELIGAGQLPIIGIGGSDRIRPDALELGLEQLEQETPVGFSSTARGIRAPR